MDVADPCAAVFASRLASDRWFCWEQPDREFALAGLGVAHEAASRGPRRFADVAEECLRTGRDAVIDDPPGLPAGAGAVWLGGFSFDPNGGNTSTWSSLAPGSLVLPELSLCRSGERTFLTLNAVVDPGEDGERLGAALGARLAGLRAEEPLPLLDPHPTAHAEIRSARPPGEFEAAVEAATARIGARGMSKVVLAREVIVSAAAAHDPAALFGAMRVQFPACFCFCCGTPEAAFIGASPELLVRRAGAGASTVALAGSTRRSSDPAVDDHLGEQLLRSDKDRREQRIVAERIVRALRPHAVWVEAAAEPEIVKIANIQHLATPVIAQLAEPHSAIELAGMLHPTPAVGGEPWAEAAETIAELERMDRGWYAGPVGWMDATEDGEFCVALRSALLRDREAHLFAGVGVVAGSDPASELAETEVKLGALLPLLAE
ncbi:MAG: menaquinone-specific isochorismate synthase [Solirubrobacterales bacterium]|jgi:salicylate biosynthesis isochorismate synthase/menaquinone-specific isochorismate synthase|nr:menaquinone-specific isochorismate synthase [Solirubrobacterales bacterium]